MEEQRAGAEAIPPPKPQGAEGLTWDLLDANCVPGPIPMGVGGGKDTQLLLLTGQ